MSGWHFAVCVCVCVCVLGHAAAICAAQAFENTVDLAGLFGHEVANDRLLLPTQAQMWKVRCCSSKTLARRLALQLIPGTKPSYLAWRNGCYKKMARQRLPGDGQRGETGLALAKPM